MYAMVDENDLTDLACKIRSVGYGIIKDAFPPDLLNQMRALIEARLHLANCKKNIIWSPCWGEEDTVCSSKDEFQYFQRGYAFPWGHDYDTFSPLNLESLRSRLLERLGIDVKTHSQNYFTWSCYPSDGGRLGQHVDCIGDEDSKLVLHYIIPLTIKGVDFEDGGLYLIDHEGNKVDVDSKLQLGDVVFFDGTRPHGVDPISSVKHTGRIQAFFIATEFQSPAKSLRFLSTISLIRYIKAKILLLLRRPI